MTTYYVGTGGNNSNDGTTWANRKLTLNGAEDIPVTAGDTVYVGPGTYRETLTVDVSGSSGSPITYIGDYSGDHTDGTGGMVRITGSDNDQTTARNNVITASGKHYRTFRGFTMDMGNASHHMVNIGGGSSNWIVEQCALVQTGGENIIYIEGAGSGNTVRRCLLGLSNGTGIRFSHSSTTSDTGHVVENCIFLAARTAGIGIVRVGGITVRNCTLIGCADGIAVWTALAGGQVTTVNNCIITASNAALKATTTAEFVENYNALFSNASARSNVSTGANSNAYPALYDVRWFMEMVGA